MTPKQLFKISPITMLLLAIGSVSGYIRLKTGLPVANTTFWWLMNASVLYLFFMATHYFFNQENKKIFWVIKAYLIWNIICIIRGTLIAETYWDWKGLIGNSMALLLAIAAYVGSNLQLLQALLRFYIKYMAPLFVIMVFLIAKEAYGFYLIPISFLILFLPNLTSYWKRIIIFLTLIILMADLGARSNVIKFAVPVIFLLIYYINVFRELALLEIARKVLFIIPFLFLFLAVSGVFNIFKMEDYTKGKLVTITRHETGALVENNLKGDTRTFLYVEVLNTAVKKNSWWFGRTPARGNESNSFGEEDLSGRNERLANEVGILNVFTWTGIIGVLLYFLIFYSASYLAINKSNNVFSKMLGLFIAFRWVYAWVEDVNNFTLNYMMLWLMIGLCFSKSFRRLTDKQVKIWVRGIFDIRYARLNHLLIAKPVKKER